MQQLARATRSGIDSRWELRQLNQVQHADLLPHPPALRRRWGKLGRVLFPFPLFAYPFYLFNRSPGKDGSHFDPNSPLFTPQVRSL